MTIENIIKNGLQSWLCEKNGTKIIEKRSIVLKTPTSKNGKYVILPKSKRRLAIEILGF